MVQAFSRKPKDKTVSLLQTVEGLDVLSDGRPIGVDERTKKVSSRVSKDAWRQLKLASLDTGLTIAEILDRLIQWGIVDGHCDLEHGHSTMG